MVRMTRWVGLAAVVMVAACATNPVTGKKELALVSESQEIQLGQEAAKETRASIGVVPDSSLQTYVRGIGLTLAKSSERPNLPWSFDVVDDPAVNAFALPGGSIFVTRGILTHMSNEAELASVIGHEIGHVTARHSVRQMSRQQIAQLGLGLGSILSSDIAALSGVASQGLGLLFLKYGRDMETEADELGFRYSLQHGYDVREMRSMFQILERVSEGSEGGKLPQWLSSHPDPENRIAKTDQRLAAVTQDLSHATVNRDPFLKHIDGLVFGENPRQGYFEGSRFNHPELAFRIDFPSGWQLQNQPSAVAGMSPQQDAMFSLSQAQGAPDAALRTFLGQQGIQPGAPSTTNLNGAPAAAADFQAQSQDGGALAGRVTFVSHNGSTYQLLGYSAAAKFGDYAPVFRQVAQSFGRLTDQAALNKQPLRVHLVRLSRDMSVEEFHRQYPSAVAVGTVALINGAGSSTEVLKGGSYAKQVR
jgi:predicted Zn-dependent protease